MFYIDHPCHMGRPGIELRPPRYEAGDAPFGLGTFEFI